jgi:transcription elongation factor GreB
MTAIRPISPEGMEKLRQEWDELFREERPRLLIEIAAAAAQGDRSENAEYIYGKKRLREIDKRLRELDFKISGSTVVEGSRRESSHIVFGARVKLKKADGKESVFQIVGVDEINPLEGKISMDSPMGKALMGRALKDKVEVITPRGLVAYEIIEVDYP